MVRAINLVTGLLIIVLSGSSGAGDNPFTEPALRYPVVSDSLSAALMEIDYALEYQPLQSLAIVGADELSARWLSINNDYLVDIAAIGLVVNVESAEQLGVLQRYTQMPLVASPSYDFARLFGAYYPLLIDGTVARVRQ